MTATFAEELPEPGTSAKPAKKRSGEETFGRLMLAIAAVILAARLVGALIARFHQPRVMGEVLAGILLGPTLLGAVWPEAKDYLFPPDIVPLFSGAAQIGLAFYLFLVGMELDPKLLRDRIGQAAFISNASVAFPMGLGFLVALPVYELLSPDVRYLPFALFMGVAMSVTAFPVLARILIERRMLKRPVGALAMAGAAIDDVTAWCLLALAAAIAGSGNSSHALQVVALAALFTAAMLLVGRRLLDRVSKAYDEVGHVPTLWLGAIFVGVLLSAYVAQQIGIAAIFGAFVMGLIMPRRAGLTADVSARFENFVVLVLLPLFFVVTGLRTEVNALNRPVLWALTLLLIAVAIAGKFLGAMLAARYGGFSLRDSAAIGALMNTRGLTELIVLNIGLDLGVISTQLFTMLVVMALVTTFMAGPILRLIDPRHELSEPVEEELRQAQRRRRTNPGAGAGARDPRRAAGREEPRRAARAGRAAREDDAAARARDRAGRDPGPLRDGHVSRRRRRGDDDAAAGREARRAGRARRRRPRVRLHEHPAGRRTTCASPRRRRSTSCCSTAGGRCSAKASRAARSARCSTRRRATSPCSSSGQGMPAIDAAAPGHGPLRRRRPRLGRARARRVDRDRARHAAEAARRRGGSNGDGDASDVLSSASLVVQQLAGVETEAVLVDLANDGLLRATEGAGLLVIGLSERWRDEGLGPVRSAIAKAAPAPILFVRRGTRPGALAPRTGDLQKFAWSRA